MVIVSDAKVPLRPPVWLRKVCQSYLQQIVSKPDGVLSVLINTIHGILQFVLTKVGIEELKMISCIVCYIFFQSFCF